MYTHMNKWINNKKHSFDIIKEKKYTSSPSAQNSGIIKW
jgi:hypothetical protein